MYFLNDFIKQNKTCVHLERMFSSSTRFKKKVLTALSLTAFCFIVLTIYFDDLQFAINSNYDLVQLFEKQLNSKTKIRNEHFLKQHHTFKQNRIITTKPFLVIMVQVHDRAEYLKHVIDSFRQVRYINESLLIFSHDVYSPKINELIDSIDFCATLQIFYPFMEREECFK